MHKLCIVPLIKVALKYPNGKVAQATFSLISDMADEERASSHRLKNASEQSNYWRSSLAVMKYASQGVKVDHYLPSLSSKTSNLDVELSPYFSDLGVERLTQIEHLVRTAGKGKKPKKPALTIAEQSAIIQDPKAKPSERKKAFASIFKALGKEGASLKKSWTDNLKKKMKVKFKTSKGTDREKEVSLKTISGFSKVKNPSLKDAYMKIWQTEYEGYIKSVVSMAEGKEENNKGKAEAPKKEAPKKEAPKKEAPKKEVARDYIDYHKNNIYIFQDDPKSKKEYDATIKEAEEFIDYISTQEDDPAPEDTKVEIMAAKELLNEYNKKFQSMYEYDY